MPVTTLGKVNVIGLGYFERVAVTELTWLTNRQNPGGDAAANRCWPVSPMFESPRPDKADDVTDPVAPAGAVIANAIATTTEVNNAADLIGATVLTFPLCHEETASYTATLRTGIRPVMSV